jgi:hypothetical protein
VIVINIFGGLGNQMFQFAFALDFILKGEIVKFNICSANNYNNHDGYQLKNVFEKINVPIADKRDFFYFMEKIGDVTTGEWAYQMKAGKYFIDEGNEFEFLYNSNFCLAHNTFFMGHWQNENYFKHNDNKLKHFFKFNSLSNADAIIKKTQELILSCNSVSIHVRRGDYLKSSTHETLSITYYQKAIRIINNNVTYPFFFIFSDDIAWARFYFKNTNMFFVNINQKNKSYIDMQLMSFCKHNIIANSTFSWWSAWLNENNEKIVIVPNNWFKTGKKPDGLLLKNWIKI